MVDGVQRAPAITPAVPATPTPTPAPVPPQPPQPVQPLVAPPPTPPLPAAQQAAPPPQPVEKIGLFTDIPKGVVIIALLTVANAIFQIASLAGASGQATQYRTPTLVANGLLVLLAWGLLRLSNIARIIFILLAGLTLLSSSIAFFGLFDKQQAYRDTEKIIQTRIDEIKQKSTQTAQDRNNLEYYERNLAILKEQGGANFLQYYLGYGVNVAYAGFTCFYLIMPKVKEEFDA